MPEVRLSSKGGAQRALEAVSSPLQATGVTLMVRLGERPSGNAPLRFDVIIDPHQITLASRGGRMTGSLSLAFIQCTAGGKVLAAKQEKGDLNFDEAAYRSALTSGFALTREWAVKPGVEQLRIAVSDGSSDNIGSIVVPLPKAKEE